METTQGQNGSTTSAGGRHHAHAILDFWFGSPNDESFGKEKAHWWSGMSSDSANELDIFIKKEFGADYEAAKNGQLDSWKNEPLSTLALILLFDQFSRNIHRGKPETYDTDIQAVNVANFAIEQGYDKKLRTGAERNFMYMPFMHSEDLNVQAKGKELFEAAGDTGYLQYAEHHYKIIEKFGRFPHRNELLGRKSTKEEVEFMESEKK